MKYYTRLLLFFVALWMSECLVPLCAQSGGTILFDDTKGDRVVSAADVKYKKFVTCSHTDDDRSCFLVEDFENNTRKKFYSTPHVEPSLQYSCSGYIVNEMVVDDGKNCWFCGSKWVRTGQYVYTIEGLLVPETLYYGYVGRFNIINDVLNGGGNMEIMLINGSDNLQHFALTPSGDIYATEDSIIYHLDPIGGGIYNGIRGAIGHTGLGGRFEGVVCTGDTIVTLARCIDQSHFFHFHDMFYLGYGPQNSFIGANTVYNFDVYWAYNDRRARMETDAPIHLTATNNGTGVTVSYIMENSDYPGVSTPGKLILFHFPYSNAPNPEILHTIDTGNYVKLKDIKSSDSVWGKPFLAALLEDNHGKSVWRLPILGTGAWTINDTVRKVQNPSFESIIPFRNPDVAQHKASLYIAGYYPFSQNRVARNIRYNIRNDNNRDLVPLGCYSTSPGYWRVDNSLDYLHQDSGFTIDYSNSFPSSFEQISFVPVSAPHTTICINSFPVKNESDE